MDRNPRVYLSGGSQSLEFIIDFRENLFAQRISRCHHPPCTGYLWRINNIIIERVSACERSDPKGVHVSSTQDVVHNRRPSVVDGIIIF